jgi:hypothetical protein
LKTGDAGKEGKGMSDTSDVMWRVVTSLSDLFCVAGGEGFNWDALHVSMKSYTLVESYLVI